MRWQEISPGRLRVQSNSAMGLLRQLHWLPNYISIDEGIPAVPGSNWLYVSTWCSFFHQHHRIIDFSKQMMTDWSVPRWPQLLEPFPFGQRCRVVTGNTPLTASGFTRIVLRLTAMGCIDSFGVWLTTTQELLDLNFLSLNIWEPATILSFNWSILKPNCLWWCPSTFFGSYLVLPLLTQ